MFLSTFAPENLVTRDMFGWPVSFLPLPAMVSISTVNPLQQSEHMRYAPFFLVYFFARYFPEARSHSDIDALELVL